MKYLLALVLLSSSAIAFEVPEGQVCVEIQRDCAPDAKMIDDFIWWYLSADCTVRVESGPNRVVTIMKPEPKYVCSPKSKNTVDTSDKK